jgi:hypothetical protein
MESPRCGLSSSGIYTLNSNHFNDLGFLPSKVKDISWPTQIKSDKDETTSQQLVTTSISP